ncbi:MAG: hypothetical protein HY906_03150 [Deltaproteobacteria bacterium]|nr:hypothetical protein [Deltaproteobacteria bacterium]
MAKELLDNDPLSGILEDQFYRPMPRAARPRPPKPAHYQIVCISLYNEDIARLEELVAELKRRGFSKANKSQLIRFALDTVDLDRMPKAY